MKRMDFISRVGGITGEPKQLCRSVMQVSLFIVLINDLPEIERVLLFFYKSLGIITYYEDFPFK